MDFANYFLLLQNSPRNSSTGVEGINNRGLSDPADLAVLMMTASFLIRKIGQKLVVVVGFCSYERCFPFGILTQFFTDQMCSWGNLNAKLPYFPVDLSLATTTQVHFTFRWRGKPTMASSFCPRNVTCSSSYSECSHRRTFSNDFPK